MGKKITDGNGNVVVQAGRVSGHVKFSGGNVQITGETDSGKSADGHMTNVISGNGNGVVQADAIHGDITFG